VENNKCDARSMRGVNEDLMWSFDRKKRRESLMYSTDSGGGEGVILRCMGRA